MVGLVIVILLMLFVGSMCVCDYVVSGVLLMVMMCILLGVIIVFM